MPTTTSHAMRVSVRQRLRSTVPLLWESEEDGCCGANGMLIVSYSSNSAAGNERTAFQHTLS
jgi:hypothetical protein